MKKKTTQAYTTGLIHQFWYEDGILHLWVNTRGGLYTIALSENEEMHFLADMDSKHKLSKERGTVYEFMGIVDSTSDKGKGQDE